MIPEPELQEIRDRVIATFVALPEVETSSRTGQHVQFTVRGKSLGYLTVDHHGDGRVALSCKVVLGEQTRLAAEDPRRYFVPGYIGHRGYAGIYLDVGEIDWDEIERVAVDGYRLIAPKRLAARV